MLLVYTSASTGPSGAGWASDVGVAEGIGVLVIDGALVAVGVGSGARVGVGSAVGVAVAAGVSAGPGDAVGVAAVTVGDVTGAGAGVVATATSPAGVGSGWLSPQARVIAAMSASSGSGVMLLNGLQASSLSRAVRIGHKRGPLWETGLSCWLPR